MNNEFRFTFSARFAYVLLSLGIICVFLYVAHGILVPVLLSMLFAILLRPVVVFLNAKVRLPHAIAAMLAVLLFVAVIGGILFFVSWKVSDIAGDWDKIKTNLNIHYHTLQRWVKQSFHISYYEQQKYIQEASKESLPGTGSFTNTMSSFTDILLNMILVPIYTFLFLIYRALFLNFLFKLFKAEQQHQLKNILCQVKIAIHSYLVGILIEVGLVSTLTSVGYMIIGIQYPILLGVITGVLNLVPYIGILVAGLLSIVATLTTSTEASLVVGVLIVNVIVQFLDNNVLVPFVVSSKVKINAFVSIISIIIGGAFAGVAGMFLAIPIIAILKVIFDHVDDFEPWGYVMGDNLPDSREKTRVRFLQRDFSSAVEKELDCEPEKKESAIQSVKNEDQNPETLK